MTATSAAERVCIALDFPSREEVLKAARRFGGRVGWLKIGLEAFVAAGPALVDEAAQNGSKVFLDLKFHDIPNTVAQAIESALVTGAWMVNVHASGGTAMMHAAAQAAKETAAQTGRLRPLVIGVTVLTSMDEATLREGGVTRPLLDQVVSLARMARDAGLDGVVASPQETASIRAACGSGFAIVTPGIRGASAGSEKNDQSRTMGPAEAIRAGATFIVVGRPIIAAQDPRGAAERIVEELSATSPR
jgi:orotidine-5'-phosphate decarboxylase